MNFDKLFISLNDAYHKDNLNKKKESKKIISKKTFYHAKNSKTTYLLLSPWHSVSFLFYPIKRKLQKMGFSYVQYDFSPDILTPSINSTEKYFEDIRKDIGADITMLSEKHDAKSFVVIGLSLSCVIASMISGISPKIQALILVVPGSSLAESLWSGIRTLKIKNEIEKRGVSLAELEKDWKDLAPENYIRNFKNKRVRIYISESDRIIPYNFGKKFEEEIREIIPDVQVRENKNLGHYGTILHFCLVSKDVII